MQKSDGIFQPNAVCEVTLMNNPTLNVRSLLLKNKDGFTLPLEQFVDAANKFCIKFGEFIVNSPSITEEDLQTNEPRNIVAHVNQDAKGVFLLVIVQDLDNKPINDPALCEALHSWVKQLSEKMGIKL